MSNKLKLSICIPTYNRAALIKEAIESILAQINEENKGQVEIVISDNASTDGTRVMVEQLKSSTQAAIRYFCNDRNFGPDRNYLLSVERAVGRYACILGSDDLLAENALALIIQEIGKNEGVGLFYCEKEDFYLTPDKPMRYRRIMNYPGPLVFDFQDPRPVDEYFR
jgi:abequosyltransferase